MTVARHAQGDTVAFRALYEGCYAELLRFATRRVGDQAADVVAETFLIAWQRLDMIEVARSRAWLFATARNVISAQRRRNHHEALAVDFGDLQLVPDGGAAVDETVVNRLLVNAALVALSAEDHEVLLLAEWDGLSAAEAAQVLGCSAATYRVRLHRSRKAFRSAYRAQEQQHDGNGTMTQKQEMAV